ncbi:MAG: LacI family DNA-binding transcriptional regulator [Clostridia bacterium]|nr:LacI family DNA-binding transcriptional regulator [Clostridia bacterium]
MKKVTIQDIADELGISRNTVSKAINNTDGLAEATREKILQKATEMGYKQFSYIKAQTARPQEQEAPQSKGEIALLCGNVIAPAHFASLMLDKLKMELSQMGYSLTTHRVERSNFEERSLPVTFVPEQARAVICIEMFDQAYDEMICALDLPVLFVDGPHKRDGASLPADQLYMENTTAITRFVNDMLARGKRRIGFIGDYEHCQSFFERYAAFQCAMLMAGVPVDERFCIKTLDPEQISQALNALPDFPDVFICANDFIADDAIYTLRKLGKSVPEDVLFCGFDDAPNSRIMTPSLTTVHIHTQIMAIAAMQLLLSRIEEPHLNYRIVHTETELIYRDSAPLE